MLLIDSDGVLVDWEDYVVRNHFPNIGLMGINKMPQAERHLRLRSMYNRDPNLFAKLHPLQGARELVDYLKSTAINWAVLSAAGIDHPCYDTVRKDKLRNLSDLFDIPEDKIIVTRKSTDKVKYAAVGRVLVDDYIRNCESFTAGGGRCVHVTKERLSSGTVLKEVHVEVSAMLGVVKHLLL